MTNKMVKQYKCYFCGKKSLSAGHMRKHEKHCTMNPLRSCRMCELMGHSPVDISEAIKLITPLPEGIDNFSILEPYLVTFNETTLPKLRELTEDCPACILAILRQSNIPAPMVFNYGDEVTKFWHEYNDSGACYDG